MKNFILIGLIQLSVFVYAGEASKPCMVVKKNMTQAEVIKLCGNATEIDTLGQDKSDKLYIIVWHYGAPGSDNNQRVDFNGDKVVSITADGKKFDELMIAFRKGEIPNNELTTRIEKINTEGCK